MIYVVDIDGLDYALFSTKKAAREYAESFKYSDGCVAVTPYEVDVEHHDLPTRLKVSGIIYGGGGLDIFMEDGDNTAWTFNSNGCHTRFTGFIDVIPGEDASELYARANAIAREKYKESLHG